ncbi:DNA polymerase III subunit gamma/tau, partial [Candidatus Saccharibacteria bacterium]|nr:DNA polymerase III subunit gamma/tau [Candidatus Saccharibacteria bacterium]
MGKGEKAKQGKQALYRQYRSTSFDEVVGQEHVTELLKTAVRNGNISHAYLFTGPRGTGKTSVARILAFAANNIPYSHDAQHLDIIEIDAASNRRIDDIRDLREKVHIAPTSAPYKVYIIDEVHMLTGESFNALLKTLEEPPAHAIFILATTEINKVPATIISRTQRFHFRPISQKKVVDHLASIAKKEGIDIDNSALELVAEHGDGSFRDSISLLDQMGNLGVSVTAELVESILGKASFQSIQNLTDAVLDNDTELVRSLLQDFTDSGISPVTLSEQLIHRFLISTDPEAYALAEDLMYIPRAQFPQLLLLSTLLRYSTPKASQTQQVTETSKTSKQPDTIQTKPEQTTKETPAETTSKKTPNIPSESKKTAANPESRADFDWSNFLATVKTKN